MTPGRPEFAAALRIFARASGAMTRQGFAAPVLVGGAAAEHARQLFAPSDRLDLACLDRCIREETGDHGLSILKAA